MVIMASSIARGRDDDDDDDDGWDDVYLYHILFSWEQEHPK